MYIYKHVKNDKIQAQHYSSVEAAIADISANFSNNATRPIGVYDQSGKTVVMNRNQLIEACERFKKPFERHPHVAPSSSRFSSSRFSSPGSGLEKPHCQAPRQSD